MKELEILKTELSKEWNKPKKAGQNKKETRDYKKIQELQKKINECKKSKEHLRIFGPNGQWKILLRQY